MGGVTYLGSSILFVPFRWCPLVIGGLFRRRTPLVAALPRWIQRPFADQNRPVDPTVLDGVIMNAHAVGVL